MRTLGVCALAWRSLSFAACAPPASTGASSAAPGGSGAKVAGSAAPAAADKPAAAELAEVDLGAAGEKWKGWTLKGPAGAKAADDGAGGLSVAFGKFQLSLTQGKLAIADLKSGVKAGAEAVEGKGTNKNETADELEHVTELKDYESQDAKVMGFAMHVDVGGTKVGCSCADAANDADLAAAKAACKSLAKK